MTIPQKGISFIPAPPRESLLDGDKDNGANDYEREFLQVGKFMLENQQILTVVDAHRLMNVLFPSREIEPQTIENLFHAWTKKLILQKRLLPVAGAYEQTVYQIL